MPMSMPDPERDEDRWYPADEELEKIGFPIYFDEDAPLEGAVDSPLCSPRPTSSSSTSGT